MRGSLQIKGDKYYMVVYTMKDGKQEQTWKSTRLPVKGNKRKAEEMLRLYLQECETKEQALEQRKEDINMTDLICAYLVVKKLEVRLNSYLSYEDTAKLHVIPYFGTYYAGELTTPMIKQYYNVKYAAGLSPETLTRHRTVLRGALDYAIDTLGLLSVNVADRAKLPKSGAKRSPIYYNLEQLKMLFKVVEGESIEAPVRLSATYGLRRSEALGLKWKAVDFNRKTIYIQHTATRGGAGVIRDDTVKELASLRTMPLTHDMEAYLKGLQAHQRQMKKLCGKDYHNSDYICVWDDGHLIQPDYLTSRFNRFLAAKGMLHIRFHDLRHSSASLLLSHGYKLEDVQKWLGHASIRSTERYAHLLVNDKSDMAADVNKLLAVN